MAMGPKRFLLLAVLAAIPASAQNLDLTGGGPVEVTSTDGIEWRQAEQVVIARGNAKAVREGVTVDSDTLIARYRNRAGSPQPAATDSPLSGGEIWRLEAQGNVRIASATDRAQGDRAVYDMDQAVMVLTGRDLVFATPDNTIRARDSLEYWSQRRMAVARGAANVVSTDNRRIQADTLVAYFLADTPPAPPARPTQPAAARAPGAPPAPGNVPGEGSKLDRVEVFGNVEIRTQAEVVRGDRGVYSPVTGIARILGNVRITCGPNQLNGAEAIVNLRTGVSRLVNAPGQRVQGLVLPSGGAQPGGASSGDCGGTQQPAQPPVQPARPRGAAR
ncbi:LptA/OstA family protein [Roseomonas sp. CCTCC AB2023176]|uniref:LptA/OstA family protein n=1 Tax=Roseomonas sp. CCTCC AB2023176 TaxID=3342640 RepID=UPI0035D75450